MLFDVSFPTSGTDGRTDGGKVRASELAYAKLQLAFAAATAITAAGDGEGREGKEEIGNIDTKVSFPMLISMIPKTWHEKDDDA